MKMTATITKTATYNAAEMSVRLAAINAIANPADRWEAREAFKAKVQRAWAKGGKVGINPVCMIGA